MGHATAADLKEVFEKSTDELPKAQLLQISMDGPNVNWSFYSKAETSFRNDFGFSFFINLGSCGLHRVQNAFQKGVEATDLQVNSLLKALHQLLKDTPARRDYYDEAARTEDGPMPKFCKTRLVENRIVFERALEVLPDTSKYVKAVEMKKFPNPKTKSFDVRKEAVHDLLTTAKINLVLKHLQHLQHAAL